MSADGTRARSMNGIAKKPRKALRNKAVSSACLEKKGWFVYKLLCRMRRLHIGVGGGAYRDGVLTDG